MELEYMDRSVNPQLEVAFLVCMASLCQQETLPLARRIL